MNQRGFFFPLAIVISTVFLLASVELTYLIKTRIEATDDLYRRTRLFYAAESGSEIFKAWYDKDPTLNGDSSYTAMNNFDSRELFNFSMDDMDIRIYLLRNTALIPKSVYDTSGSGKSSLRCLFFSSVSNADNPRRKIDDSEASYGFYYFTNENQSSRHWFEFCR